MLVTILGCGTSTGVPELGCRCKVCRSDDFRDRRLRTSVHVEIDGVSLLLDCGPDFREQAIRASLKSIDAVLISHTHYDHVAGIDDLRPFTRFNPIDIYCNNISKTYLERNFSYCFGMDKYPGSPRLELHEIKAGEGFEVKGVQILPLEVMHGKLPVLGYRIGGMAYITDMSLMSEETFCRLGGLELLLVNALRIEPHATHQSLGEAIDLSKRIAAKKTVFIHMSHQIGLHREVCASLPESMSLAYDGQTFEV